MNNVEGEAIDITGKAAAAPVSIAAVLFLLMMLLLLLLLDMLLQCYEKERKREIE